jgi:hypothetical protein
MQDAFAVVFDAGGRKAVIAGGDGPGNAVPP